MKAKSVNESLNEGRVSSRGKKTDAILQFIEEAGPEGRGFVEIQKFAYEYTHGEGAYTADNEPIKTRTYPDGWKSRSGGNPHRGYWSGGFKTPSPDDRSFGHLMKYIIKNENGKWILRDDVMSDDEVEFHGRRINYGDSEYKPGLYKKGGNKEREIESWEEDEEINYSDDMLTK